MKRMFGKRKRWVVQHRRIGGPGTARWLTSSEHWDYGEAWGQMLGNTIRERQRVFDRRAKLEVLWPDHEYAMAPRQSLWVGIDPAEKRAGAFSPAVWSDAVLKAYKKEQQLTNMMAKNMADKMTCKITQVTLE